MKSLVQTINERGVETYTKDEFISELTAIIDEIKDSDCNKWCVWFKKGALYPSSLACEVTPGSLGTPGEIIFSC